MNHARIVQCALVVTAVAFGGVDHAALGQDRMDRHSESIEFTRAVEREVTGSYRVYLPPDYESRDAWPLVIFLHGSGERGADLDLVEVHGPPKHASQGASYPFILVAPQCPADDWWPVSLLDGVYDDVLEKFRVDTDRIYLTGLSMGGFGTWEFALRYPGRFAAIAPVCGGGNHRVACRLKDVPVWAFHGEDDPVVDADLSRQMVDAVNACGGSARLTIYPETGHDSWTATYANPELYEWLLSHTRRNDRE